MAPGTFLKLGALAHPKQPECPLSWSHQAKSLLAWTSLGAFGHLLSPLPGMILAQDTKHFLPDSFVSNQVVLSSERWSLTALFEL